MVKLRKNVTIEDDLVRWVEAEIKKKRFASLSHAIEYALTKIQEEGKTKPKS